MTEYLFKFRDLVGCNRERVKQIITESKIWFASPRTSNDPFDGSIQPTFGGSNAERRLYWGNAIAFQLGQKGYYSLEPEFTDLAMRGQIDPFEEVMQRAKRGEISIKPEFLQKTLSENMARDSEEEERHRILSGLQQSIHELGVLSLSGTREEILLWSHYSDSHRGLCIEFRVQSESSPFGSSLLASSEAVAYQDTYPEISLYEVDQRAWRRAILLTKAKQWKYEQEYRCIDPVGEEGLREFPEEQLTGIIFGCQMLEEDRVEVREWAQARNAPTRFYEAIRVNRQFALEIVECQ